MFTIQLFSHNDDSGDGDDSDDDDHCDELYREKSHRVDWHNDDIRDDNDDDDCNVGAPVRQREAAGEGHGWRQKLWLAWALNHN